MKKAQLLLKRTMFFSFSFLFLTASFLSIQAAGGVDAAFNPALTKAKESAGLFPSVNRITVQPDGKALIAGYFQAAGKFDRSGIVRLNTDGTVDTTFNPPKVFYGSGISEIFGGNIYAVTVQPDGKILIGGEFTTINGVPRKNIARLNADGSLDVSFNFSAPSPSIIGTIKDIKVYNDGRIIFGGRFIYNSSSINRESLLRVFADGSIDTSFNQPSVSQSGDVSRIELISGGKILIAGNEGSPGYVYRLNNDGSRDNSFTTVSVNFFVLVLKVQVDGKFFLGGLFTTVNGFPVKGLARFNADGSIDTSFDITGTGPNDYVSDVEILSNGMVLVAGAFSSYNGNSRTGVALLNSNGAVDGSLVYGGSQLIAQDTAVLPDGKILVGSQIQAIGTSGNFSSALVRLNNNGSLDTSFNLLVGNVGKADKVLVQPDGKVLIGGVFTHINGEKSLSIARVNIDGTNDTTFTTNPNFFVDKEVYGLDVRADGKILVSSSNFVYRLNSNGTYDTTVFNSGALDAKFLPDGNAVIATFSGLRLSSNSSFNAAADGYVRKVLIQPDGKFVVVGDFTTIAGAARGRVARFNADGTLDTTFNTPGGAGNSIFDAALQTDGKIIVGGSFTGINFNNNYKYLARLNADGTLDTSFNPSVEGSVQSLKLQPNGKILVGGSMSSVNGLASRIVRLNQDGSLDATFNPGAGPDNAVLSIDLDTSGNVIIGGSFTRVNNIDRLAVARLSAASTAKSPFDFDGDGKADLSVFRPDNGSWYIQQSTAGFTGLQFGISTDKLAPADYDGDGKTDVAVVRNGNWYLQRSSAGFTGIAFGDVNDIPVPADYDGDGKSELAVFRPSNGYWYILNLTNNQFTATQFGISTDKPVPADYDGDGKTDVAVNRNGNWYIQRSQLGFTGILFGDGNDKTVPADYDGDGKADLAVFRPSNGTWYLQQSSAGFVGTTFGLGTDIPTAADYDGDGKADIAVFRNGTWYLNRSTQGFTGAAFGASTDKPIPNVFVK